MAQARFTSFDYTTNARQLITVMQGYTALAVRSDDPNIEDVEVVMLGPGNSVLILPGREVYWEAVTDFILLENLEWVMGSLLCAERLQQFASQQVGPGIFYGKAYAVP